MGPTKRVIIISHLVIVFLAISCGEDSNINAIFISEEKSNNINALLDDAEQMYDTGDYSGALEQAQKAYDFNNNNEKAAVLLSYIHLSIAGIDSFQLASSLIDQNTSTSTTTSLAETTTTDTTCTNETGAVAALCKLGSVIGLSTTDKENMTTDAGSSANYRLPKSASESRDSGVGTINSMKNAISLICPFVNIHAKLLTDDDRSAVSKVTKEETIEYGSDKKAIANTRTTSDPRHSIETCAPNTSGSSILGAKAHYLWSFAHLVEGIAFYAVFSANISPLADDMANLSATDTSSVGISAFLAKLDTITAAINQMMPTDATAASDSMLTAVFNDLEAASRGFGQISGMPASITSKITDSVTQLKESMAKITSTGSASATVMKDQFTTSITKELQGKVTDGDGNLTALGTQIKANDADKTAFCTSYDELSTSDLTGLCD